MHRSSWSSVACPDTSAVDLVDVKYECSSKIKRVPHAEKLIGISPAGDALARSAIRSLHIVECPFSWDPDADPFT